MDRRQFLKTSAVATALATGGAPAFAQGTRIHLLQWSHFIPAADVLFEAQAKEFGKQAGVEVAIERINQNDIQARVTAAVQSGAGPDIIIVANNHPLLYESSLVDVSDVADEIGGKQGGWYDYAKSNCLAGGHWVGVPYFIISWAVTYREDWLREAGFEYPKTWDDFRKVGRAMKAKGRPCYNSCVMKYSKHRKVAKDFVRYYMDRAQYDKYFETMDTFGIPGTKVYREHPMWKKDAKTAVFPETLQYARQVGYAGPAGRKATEALSKYISVDMLAKAIQGLRAEDAVAWATGELRKIYAA